MPPLRPVPGPAESLDVRQVGDRLRLSWKAPTRNQDGTTEEVNLVEARISRRVIELPSAAPEPPSEPPPDEAAPPTPPPTPAPIATPFDPEASRVSTVESRELGAELFYEDVVEPDWIGKRVEYMVVYANRRNREGPPSALVSIDPRTELASPVAPAAEPADGFVSLSWSAPEGADASYAYDVYRRLQEESRYGDARLNPEPLSEFRFEDRTAVLGTPVCYVVASVAVTPPVEPGESPEPGEPAESAEPDPDAPSTAESRGSIESRPSEEVCLTPEDRFAPEVPSGLVAVPSSDGILLTWRASASVDLRGYRVYGSDSASGEPAFLAEVGSASYNDATLAPGQTRFYVVTAIDDAPAVNESEKSEIVEATRPQ
jgi:hypothetical protein